VYIVGYWKFGFLLSFSQSFLCHKSEFRINIKFFSQYQKFQDFLPLHSINGS
jgi:hypothetical protein